MTPLAWIVVLFYSVAVAASVVPQLEDLVVSEGYPLQTFVVRTEDNVNLALYRIPYGKHKPVYDQIHPPVVYLQHGLLDTSAAFLMNGASGSLAFILADNGYDVWMGNSRGNTFSNFSIQSTDMDEDMFWDFSLDELVIYDLPSTIRFVLDETGADDIIYIGHSQGTTIAHALFSLNHPITHHIRLAIMMSPSAYAKHITSHLIRGMVTMRLDRWGMVWGYHRFLPVFKNLHFFAGPFCRETRSLCADWFSLFYGYNPKNLNSTRWGVYLAYTPAGASVKLMEHWAQSVRAKNATRFQMFDYGKQCWSWRHRKKQRCNQEIYQSQQPPEYDLRNIRIPMVYFYGGHDALSDLVDVKELIKVLPTGVLKEEHFEGDYTHLDFIWGMDAPERIYAKILKRISLVVPQ